VALAFLYETQMVRDQVSLVADAEVMELGAIMGR
jgi:hypothetical protein